MYGNLAAICGMQSRFAELTELLEKALKINPNYPEAYNYLGNACHARGDFDQAIQHFQMEIKLKNNNHADAFSNMGNVVKDMGLIDNALVSCSNALHLDFLHADAHNNMGNALKEKDMLEDALA